MGMADMFGGPGWPTPQSIYGPRPQAPNYGTTPGTQPPNFDMTPEERMRRAAELKAWDKKAAGLGDAKNMSGGMSMLALAQGLLAGASNTPRPVSIGQGIAAGLPGMLQQMRQGPKDFMANEMGAMKMQDALTARRTAAANLAATKKWQATLKSDHPAYGLPPEAAMSIYLEMVKAKIKPEKFNRGVKGVKNGVPGVWRFSTTDAGKKEFVPTPGIKTGSASERIRERLQRSRSDPSSEEYGQAFADLYLRPHMSQDAGGKSVLIPASPVPRNAILPTLPDNGGQRFSPEAYEGAGYKFHAGTEGKGPWLARTLERKKTLTQQQQMVLDDEVSNARQGLEDVDTALQMARQPAVVGMLAEARGAAEWFSSQFNVGEEVSTPVMDFRKAITNIKSVDWKNYVGGGGLSSGDKEWLNTVVPGSSAWDTPKKAVQTLERLKRIGQKKLYRKLIQSGDINVTRNYVPPAGVLPADMDGEEYERFTAWRLVFPERFRRWRDKMRKGVE